MRRLSLLAILILPALQIFSQDIHIGIFGGAAAYQGDLTDKIFPKKVLNGVIGVTLNYEYNERITFRGGFNYAVVGGDDRYSRDTALVHRNLNFETSITEFSLLGEYYLFNLSEQKFSPYFFAGLALYH